MSNALGTAFEPERISPSAGHSMQLNVTHKIFLVTITASLALILLVLAVLGTFNQVVETNDRLTQLNEALKNHQSADMMHDAIRGDVISFLLASATADTALADSSRAELASHGRQLQDRIEANKKLNLPQQIVELLEPTITPLQQYLSSGNRMMSATTAEGTQQEASMTAFMDSFEQLEGAMAAVSEGLVTSMQDAQSTNKTLVTGFKRTLFAGLGLAAVLLVIVSLLVARSVPRPFAQIIAELSQTSSLNASAANLVANSSTELADSSNNQAASLEEISASLEEVAGMTTRNTDNAQRAKSLSGSARNGVDAGTEQMARMVSAMDAIKGASEDIAVILKTIDEIAFQTNILALNAAVEAARAGEAGAGFAVVADEVRALARRSADAASQVDSKISDAINRSDFGVTVCSEVSEQLASVAQQVREMDDLMMQIANASSEQAQNTQQVNLAVSEMDATVQRSAAQAQESSSTANDLSQQAVVLESIVQRLGSLVGRAGNLRTEIHSSIKPARSSATTRQREFAVVA